MTHNVSRMLIAFLSGVVYEIGCVFWCTDAAGGNAHRTAAWSMLVATCQLAGIGEGLTGIEVGVCYVLGFGTGSYLGVLISKRKKNAAERETS
jgi:hypothetical protein